MALLHPEKKNDLRLRRDLIVPRREVEKSVSENFLSSSGERRGPALSVTGKKSSE